MKVGKDLHMLLMKFMSKNFLKFLLAGGLNTLITYLIYLLLILYFQYNLAYGIAYLLGIISSYLMNSLFVFKEKLSIKKIIQFPLVYLIQFMISIVFLYIFVELIKVNAKLAPIIVIALTTPVIFLLSKYILTGRISDKK
jgi:putative flippase GtrA